MKYISLILLVCFFLSISAQEKDTYQDIFVGKYEGYVNESDYGDTASGYWSSRLKILSITNSNYGDTFVYIGGIPEISGLPHYRTFEDSVLIQFYVKEYNNPDSIFYNCFGTTYTYKGGVGKLFSDSTFEFWYYVPPANGDYWGYFKGKKIESYVSVNNNIENISHIKIFPNPVKNSLNIDIPNNLKSKKLKIYDIYGKEVISKFLFDNKTKINISDLPRGVYFVKIGVVSGKFVKM